MRAPARAYVPILRGPGPPCSGNHAVALARIMKSRGGMLPTKILVPTDLSQGADQALDYAIELAAKVGAQVHLLNVVGIPALGIPELGLAAAATTIDSVVRENQIALAAIAARKSVTGQVLQRTGDAKESILQVATELGIDLIVMGTHGRTGLKRVLLGSIAEGVVRHSTCPVLTVHTKAIHRA